MTTEGYPPSSLTLFRSLSPRLSLPFVSLSTAFSVLSRRGRLRTLSSSSRSLCLRFETPTSGLLSRVLSSRISVALVSTPPPYALRNYPPLLITHPSRLYIVDEVARCFKARPRTPPLERLLVIGELSSAIFTSPSSIVTRRR